MSFFGPDMCLRRAYMQVKIFFGAHSLLTCLSGCNPYSSHSAHSVTPQTPKDLDANLIWFLSYVHFQVPLQVKLLAVGSIVKSNSLNLETNSIWTILPCVPVVMKNRVMRDARVAHAGEESQERGVKLWKWETTSSGKVFKNNGLTFWVHRHHTLYYLRYLMSK